MKKGNSTKTRKGKEIDKERRYEKERGGTKRR
jgi:hypothetical protein